MLNEYPEGCHVVQAVPPVHTDWVICSPAAGQPENLSSWESASGTATEQFVSHREIPFSGVGMIFLERSRDYRVVDRSR